MIRKQPQTTNMKSDGLSIDIRELRQEEASEVRDMIMSGLCQQNASHRTVFKVLRMPVGWLWVGFLVVSFYSVTSSWLASVTLAVLTCLPATWALLYARFRIKRHFERLELQDLYTWYGSRAGSKFWVAVFRGKIIGTIALHRTSGNAAKLKRMTVLPRFRGRGVATRLMKHCEEYCGTQGVERIHLRTSQFQQDALRLYLKFGYTITEKFTFSRLWRN
ncbi:PREDICTED: N-acetylaspartate synthetase-like [Branchiostoma belcheri]|uniref:N-acetylaspartate synthetase-like n=1 Tax=Branchiostoma belcheri TaxID=7741 RepID=A0A6P4ZGS7_BRABE|nr:PREDICTED: N-acetylaspartate synthetase-like [Branchiostoma belcheri]